MNDGFFQDSWIRTFVGLEDQHWLLLGFLLHLGGESGEMKACQNYRPVCDHSTPQSPNKLRICDRMKWKPSRHRHTRAHPPLDLRSRRSRRLLRAHATTTPPLRAPHRRPPSVLLPRPHHRPARWGCSAKCLWRTGMPSLGRRPLACSCGPGGCVACCNATISVYCSSGRAHDAFMHYLRGCRGRTWSLGLRWSAAGMIKMVKARMPSPCLVRCGLREGWSPRQAPWHVPMCQTYCLVCRWPNCQAWLLVVASLEDQAVNNWL